jgi:hypothetical protein
VVADLRGWQGISFPSSSFSSVKPKSTQSLTSNSTKARNKQKHKIFQHKVRPWEAAALFLMRLASFPGGSQRGGKTEMDVLHK